MGEKGKVCVTGAGGYLASWVVKYLLSKGYTVHGTVRDPDDEKNGHLKRLENADKNLQLFKADLLDYESLLAAIKGCVGVFHCASPVPAIRLPNPENNYCLSKTVAEREALQYAEKTKLDVVTVCPSLILGPNLQPTLNSSILVLIKILTGEHETMENKTRVIVDVRDVAEAVLLAYEKPEASGRYICAPHKIKMRDLVDKLKSMYPNYQYPKNFKDIEDDENITSEKLKRLGWQCRPLEETLVDTVEHFEKAGILNKA